MNKQDLLYSHRVILKNLVQYLPAKLIVILNSFFIIPLLTYFLNIKEVSIYLISLQILNISCTCSSDWIAKAVLRFYEKYRLNKKLEDFLSTIFWLSVFVYVLVCVIIFCFKPLINNHFAVNSTILLLVGILLVPCAVRQHLYQILRVRNNYWLYTLSIIIYQLLFIILFISTAGLLPNAGGIIIAMITSITIINIYIIKTIPKIGKIMPQVSFPILQEVLTYGLPLVITNAGYWLVFNIPKFIFQVQEKYIDTSVLGIGWVISVNVVETIAGLFIFVNFPKLVKIFEHNRNVKTYFTNTLQLYFYILLPIILCFYYYSGDIVKLILPNEYSGVKIVLPIFVLVIFIHQLVKLINIRFHLKNKTYIETLCNTSVVALSILTLFIFRNSYSLKAALFIMLGTELAFFVTNMLIRFKNSDYYSYSKLFKTFICLCLICFSTIAVLNVLFFEDIFLFILLKIIMYFIICYSLGYYLRKVIFT